VFAEPGANAERRLVTPAAAATAAAAAAAAVASRRCRPNDSAPPPRTSTIVQLHPNTDTLKPRHTRPLLSLAPALSPRPPGALTHPTSSFCLAHTVQMAPKSCASKVVNASLCRPPTAAANDEWFKECFECGWAKQRGEQ
jgi:hypothetical protein